MPSHLPHACVLASLRTTLPHHHACCTRYIIPSVAATSLSMRRACALLCETSAEKCAFPRRRWAVTLAIIAYYASKVEEALEMVGVETCATKRGWTLGPSRAAATLPRGEGRAGWW